MGLFNRKKQSTDSDINNYYASERRRRVGMAWLLGIITFILTIILAIGFFYGGRWLYRTIFSNETNTSEQQGESEQPDTTTDSGSDENAEEAGNNDGTIPGFGFDDTEERTSDESEERTNQADEVRDDDGTPPSRTIPSTGPSPETLPSTGPSQPEI